MTLVSGNKQQISYLFLHWGEGEGGEMCHWSNRVEHREARQLLFYPSQSGFTKGDHHTTDEFCIKKNGFQMLKCNIFHNCKVLFQYEATVCHRTEVFFAWKKNLTCIILFHINIYTHHLHGNKKLHIKSTMFLKMWAYLVSVIVSVKIASNFHSFNIISIFNSPNQIFSSCRRGWHTYILLMLMRIVASDLYPSNSERTNTDV